MQVIRFSNSIDEGIYCPFCGKQVLSATNIDICPHVLFHACSEGWSFVKNRTSFIESEDVEAQIKSMTDAEAFCIAIDYRGSLLFTTYVGFSALSDK